ncbi:single-stranded-DNA-specific exonuclease RecJ [Thermosyntropha sp.]|uniref:single-stranded-DNA-specific exonuclease RecJ n=1 Tax=Thermosyntropha sp. TaxID=2740820 RepID=UPI0025DFC529|nr:single-stranded-DNA-specific exonuclease RecJ [Thermosyntropha sp.]MBO8159297.1 single-stranded-DNA-specific exonuclease RecJ [Thermosyntropha sp.]
MAVWQLKSFNYKDAEVLKNKLDISLPFAALLTQRGINSEEKARKFLFGGLKDLISPYDIKGINEAVVRIKKAVESQEKIVVYGDYDVDGVCSTVIMLKCLEYLNCKADYYIPDRFTEGYGMNEEAVVKLAESGYNLIISVDCGISSVKEVEKAKEMGLDVIITDHHTPPSVLPEAEVIINPKLDVIEDVFNLSGAGVVFKLAQALVGDKAHDWLELAALATVADIMPLTGDNRIIVKEGLKRLKFTRNAGLKALLNKTGLADKEDITPWHLSFIIAPRINSAGRLDKADKSIELFLSDDEDKCNELAEMLCNLNNERRSLEESIGKEAVLKIENEVDLSKEKIIVVAGENWHHGVIGIVAARICEKYNRPAILISWEGDKGRGSGRSIEDISLYDALSSCSSELIHFGGHRMAAGFSIQKDKFNAFKNKLHAWAETNITESSFESFCLIDYELQPEDISCKLLDELEMLKPYGEGNDVPYFMFRRMEIASINLVGKDKEHAKINLTPGEFSAVAFGRPDFFELPWKECYHDLVFSLDYNEFRGNKSIQLKIKEMKPSFLPDNLLLLPDRFKSNIDIVEKCLAEIKKQKPVILLYPTYRVLKKHKIQLELFFKSEVLCELHGRISLEKRNEIKKRLIDGNNKIFLMTKAFFDYMVKKGDLDRLPLIIQVMLKGSFDSGYTLMHFDERKKKRFFNIKWMKDWQYTEPKKVLMYTNRKSTVQLWKEKIPDLLIEAGEDNLRIREGLRRGFSYGDKGVLLTDGAAGISVYGLDELVFADMPLNIYEALMVTEQIVAADEVRSIALFNPEKIYEHDDFLKRNYPDLDTVKKVLVYLLQAGKNPLCFEIDKLAADISNFVAREMKPSDLIPVFYILIDLGLCQIRKKGNIMKIKLIKPNVSKIDISDSPYYLEGLAEKKAFCEFKSEIIRFWRGDDNGPGKNN